MKNRNKDQDNAELNRRIFNLFRRLNFDSSLLGYQYMKLAVLLCLEDDKKIHSLQGLYREIADTLHIEGCTRSKIERGIRHLIKRTLSAHENNSNSLLYEIFGDIVNTNQTITNKRFICQIVEYLKNADDKEKTA